jgi:hypothetical protein
MNGHYDELVLIIERYVAECPGASSSGYKSISRFMYRETDTYSKAFMIVAPELSTSGQLPLSEAQFMVPFL